MERIDYKTLPSLPGIYLFKQNDTILYVGKAKCLKKRVTSYFQKKGTDWKIDMLLQEHTHIEHIVTHSESDALLLEAQLIRDNKPKFNVLLKNGQPFLYIMVSSKPLPTLELVRNKKDKGIYFGPFLHKIPARSVYNYVIRVFKLWLCKSSITQGCLDYHLGRCAGNCLKENFDKEGYLFRLELVQQLLKGNYKQSLKALETQIKELNKKLEFEKAQHLHQYVQHLEIIFDTLQAKFSEKKYRREIVDRTVPSVIHNYEQVSQQLQQLFNLPRKPRTIDCFDISHFQSSYIVGSCIRFTNGKPDKNMFRRFRVRTLQKQNDYAALQEIVSRRYKHVSEIPDLVLIDGGKGQLNAVKDIASTTCISLAKREERIFSANLQEGIVLDVKTDLGKLLIALRDYAHHFAVSYHRNRRHNALEKEQL